MNEEDAPQDTLPADKSAVLAASLVKLDATISASTEAVQAAADELVAAFPCAGDEAR